MTEQNTNDRNAAPERSPEAATAKAAAALMGATFKALEPTPPPAPTENAGTYADPIRYEEIKRDDPNRQAKLAAQREQFEADARSGKILCLSDLLCNHGL
ncbi:MAG: hypothetical protein BWY28_03268 [bacterium ADurb.Bin236]|nr:MAG: hypothetical protein BWY28_03268 [bacterium ADurb.Bin236]